jgi:uncharacterized membrane protein
MPYTTSPSDTGVSDAFAALGTIALIAAIVNLVILVLVIIAWWKIASKAGYSGAWALILFIPVINFIFFLIFAFSKWPVLQELEQRRMQGGVPPNVPVGAPYPPQL